MIRFFLERPVFAMVCSAAILLAGAVVIPTLPIAQFPKIAPPVVTVTATWTGANAQAVESSVTTPLEEAINGVEGLRYITSTSTNAGISTITCTFNLGTNLDIAATDVQNAVATANALLPSAVQQTGVTVSKNSGAFVMAYGFSSSNPQFDTLFLSNYVDLNIVDPIKRISGVSNVTVFGDRKYAMRLWVDPKRLADNGLSPDDVVTALNAQNVAVAAGAIGGAPAAANQPFQINVRAVGRLSTPQQFGDLILRTLPNGGYVRFRDVGRVDLGAQDYSQIVRFDGRPAVGIGIQALPTANALDVAKAVRAAMADFQHDFPPGVTAKVAFDSTEFVTESLREVLITLGISIALVVLVIFIFLQDARTTIVPVITIPVSLIGTFAILKVLGFSINTLTMFGLTLATGLVVDDAIVVIENIARFIQINKLSPLRGAAAAMDEITAAVIASSLVLLAVFVPVAFFPGTTGQLYRQFALTIAGSVAISLFVALTLTPVLSRLLLSNAEHQSRFFVPVNRVIDGTRRLYARVLPVLVRGRMIVVALYLVGIVATMWLQSATPTGFLPDEDPGYFFAMAQGPEEASLPSTAAAMANASDVIASYPEVSDVFVASGQDFLASGTNRGACLCQAEAVVRARRRNAFARRDLAAARAEALDDPGGTDRRVLSAGDPGLRERRGISIRVGGPHRSRIGRAPTRLLTAGRSRERESGPLRGLYHVPKRRTAARRRHRSPEGLLARRPATERFRRDADLAWLALRQPVRLHAPFLSGVRPGRRAVSLRAGRISGHLRAVRRGGEHPPFDAHSRLDGADGPDHQPLQSLPLGRDQRSAEAWRRFRSSPCGDAANGKDPPSRDDLRVVRAFARTACQRVAKHGRLRARDRRGVSRARREIREPHRPADDPAVRSSGDLRRSARPGNASFRERRLRPSRLRDADRPREQERDLDRRVRQPTESARPRHRGRRDRGRRNALPADRHDVAGLHHRDRPVGLRVRDRDLAADQEGRFAPRERYKVR
jgi:hypothetical protein